MKNYSKPITNEARYVDFDEEIGLWCVFGTESGHAYSSHADQKTANKVLTKFYENNKRTC